MTMQGFDLIRAERIRQVHSEGYKPEKDAGREAELVNAARAYLTAANNQITFPQLEIEIPGSWPWDSKFFKPTETKRMLIKAGALVAAAIDALPEEDNA